MEACYGGTDLMERSCAVARGIDIEFFRVRLAWQLPRAGAIIFSQCCPK